MHEFVHPLEDLKKAEGQSYVLMMSESSGSADPHSGLRTTVWAQEHCHAFLYNSDMYIESEMMVVKFAPKTDLSVIFLSDHFRSFIKIP